MRMNGCRLLLSSIRVFDDKVKFQLYTVTLLFSVCSEKFHIFCGVLHNRERFLVNSCDKMFKLCGVAGNRERFFGNEGKDVKQ